MRVDSVSSNGSRIDANPNTGEPLALNRHMISADNTVQRSATHPSRIILLLAPAKQ